MTGMHVNYRYVLEKCHSLLPDSKGKILDYGCGAGDIVYAGQIEGFDIYGVETFYEGGDTSEFVRKKGLLGDTVRELDDNFIPFPDDYFDLVVSNQVFEHVSDLHIVLNEIYRVLKPAGRLLCLFPSKDVIREGHCGIPFIHWFPKERHYRYYWILPFRVLGFGYYKLQKTPQQWSLDIIDWLDKFTFYRSYTEIHDTLLAHFSSLHHIEEDYISYRLTDKKLWLIARFARVAPVKYLSRWLCRKLGGLVIVAKKD